MEYNIKLEIELVKLKFKRVWFSDKSGYWFEKKVKYKDFKLTFVIETDNKLFFLDCETFEYFNRKLNKRNRETIAKFKCDLKTIKQVLKRYK